ncbi:MAG: 4Fe-4S dicluster domain-containing protein [Phycisphaerales bacterium]
MSSSKDISLPINDAQQSGCGCSSTQDTSAQQSGCGCSSTQDTSAQNKVAATGRSLWRSLGAQSADAEASAFAAREFSAASDVLEGDDRRNFIKIMGAGFALAGMGLTGCRRWPESKIVPNASQPANRTPGVSVTYSTAVDFMGIGYGLVATSFDGRPIKLDGNSAHPYWGGTSTSWMQSRVLELYDPDRSRQVFRAGKPSTDAEFKSWLGERAKAMQAKQGDGLVVLTEKTSSPTMLDMIARFTQAFPKAKVVQWNPIFGNTHREGSNIAFGQSIRSQPQLENATVIVALDWDPFSASPFALRNMRSWADGRRVRAEDPTKQTQNRMYVVEAGVSVSGMAADSRLAVRRGDMPVFVAMIAQALGMTDGVLGDSALKSAIVRLASCPASKSILGDGEKEIFEQLVKDLKGAKGTSVLVCGDGQPAEVVALVAAINESLGAHGTTLNMEPMSADTMGLPELVKSMNAGQVDTLMILGANPCYNAPADLDFSKAMGKVPNVARVAYYRDETSMDPACTFHVPQSHFLESWGDVCAPDGTLSVQQPLIQPMIDPAQGGHSAIEALGMLLTMSLGDSQPQDGYAMVRRTHMALSGLAGSTFESAWRTWLDTGVIAGKPITSVNVSSNAGDIARAVNTLADAQPANRDASVELCFMNDARVFDGCFANNGWLQELPDPVTKITWDNALLMSVPTMRRLGLSQGSMVTVNAGGRSMKAAAFPVPGMVDDCVSITLGCGRAESAGRLAVDAGFNAYPMRTTSSMRLVRGATVQATGAMYTFAHTQDHGSVDAALIPSVPHDGVQERLPTLVRQTSLASYKTDPAFASELVHMPHRLSLWQENNLDGAHFRWAMSVDLTTCTGCSACVTACQSENNIPIVGKDQVKRGREMFWIRIDRYFRGSDPAKPNGFAIQPVACMHCENAPCEQVCPVAATVHDADGINSMVYNRCIGTRYCSNNCPYKVRRFNFFDYQRREPVREQSGPLAVKPEYYVDTGPNEWVRMQLNPEVTVRMRGVMEKCSFCVQRIAAAKIKYKNEWVKAGGTSGGTSNFSIPDGAIVTACQQACPAQAIVFGDLNDPKSQVSKLHASKLSYGMLEELNVKPRVKYMAKVINPAVDHLQHEGYSSSPAHEHATNLNNNHGAHS